MTFVFAKLQPKTILLAFAMLASIAFLTSPVHAVVIASEDFSYADTADLDGLTGGSGFSGAWAAGDGLYAISGGEAVGTGNYTRTFDAAATAEWANGGVIWGSFDMQVSSGTITQWAGLSLFDGGTELSIIGDWFNQGVWSMDWKSPQVRVNSDVDHDGTDRKAVIKFDIDNQQIDVWIGDNTTDLVPVIGTPDLSAATSAALANTDTIRLGSNGSVTSFALSYDNIIFATTALEVGGDDTTVDPIVVGDVDGDEDVDIDDFILIRDNFRTAAPANSFMTGDISGPEGTRDLFVDFYDFSVWAAAYESAGGNLSEISWVPTPEPSSALLAMLGLALAGARGRAEAR